MQSILLALMGSLRPLLWPLCCLSAFVYLAALIGASWSLCLVTIPLVVLAIVCAPRWPDA